MADGATRSSPPRLAPRMGNLNAHNRTPRPAEIGYFPQAFNLVIIPHSQIVIAQAAPFSTAVASKMIRPTPPTALLP